MRTCLFEILLLITWIYGYDKFNYLTAMFARDGGPPEEVRHS